MPQEPGRPESSPLPPYEVLCVALEERSSDGHAHVTGITTRDPDGGETAWTLRQVVTALDSGEEFVVAAAGAKGSATLRHGACPNCSQPTLQTDPPEALAKLGRC